jgi:hypothetical protein
MFRSTVWLGAGLLLATPLSARAENYVGKEFPNFTAKDALTGESLSLKSLRGSMVLVDFWATW